jgi:hypothetical protein
LTQNAKKSDENANAIAGMHFLGKVFWRKWFIFVSCPITHAERKHLMKVDHINPL